MGSLDDSFTQLLGHQPSDKDRQELYRVRDALKLKATDAVWLLLMALGYYKTLYEQVPERIAKTAKDVTDGVRAAAEAEARAALEQTKRALADAVRQASVKVARDAAGAAIAKWVTIAVGLMVAALLLVGWGAAARGRREGTAVGENVANKACGALVAATSWANSPDGQLAYSWAKAGGFADVARCSGRGMTPSYGWCTVQSDRGKVLARWASLSGDSHTAGGRR